MDFAKENNITLGSNAVYMSGKSITHATREVKQNKGIAVSDNDLINFPKNRSKMSLYFDKETRNFTYTDGQNKFIIHPNYKIKTNNGKIRIVNFITASKTNGKEFNMQKYKKIK